MSEYVTLKERLEQSIKEAANKAMVTVPLERYEMLVDVASRVDAVIRVMKSHNVVTEEEILLILGAEKEDKKDEF